jgi:hypothetical protein
MRNGREEREGESPVVISTVKARQGQTTGRMRVILGVSLALAVILMVVAYVLLRR